MMPANKHYPVRAILWMIAATFFSAAGQAQARHLTESLHPLQVVFFSTFGAVIWMLPWLMKRGMKKLKTTRHKRYWLRALLELGGWASAYYAIMLLPLPAFTALTFLQPLLVTTLAVLVFHEKSTPHTWIALLVGFVGVAIVLRPDFSGYRDGALFVLLAVCCFSACSLIIKTLTRTESPAVITFYMLFLSGLLAAPLAISVWQTPPPSLWLWIALVGLTMTMTQFCVSHAITNAPLTTIVPFSFCALLFSSAFAYYFFEEVVNHGTIIGGFVILGSAVYALYFTRRATRREEAALITQHMVEP